MQHAELVSLLKKECNKRTKEEVSTLLSYLQHLNCTSCIPDAGLERICQFVRYEAPGAGTVLYRVGDRANCWYILISGSVIIEDVMFVPPSSFGKRVSGSTHRQTDCVILDDSELIVIDYMSSCQEMTETEQQEDPMGLDASLGQYVRQISADSDIIPTYLLTNHDSTSSSANGSIYDSLKETSVDSDADDAGIETFSLAIVKDAVKDCLDKRPEDRSEDDIEVILDFMQHFPAFSNMTIALRRAMCAVAVYAVIDAARTRIYADGQEFDAWSVIINGEVEVVHPDGNVVQLNVGDSFGLQPIVSQNSAGTMFTKTDNCQFVCVAKEDFYKILHQGVENTEKVEEQGKVVLVTEKRPLRRGNRTGNVVIRGIPEKLIRHLVDDQSSSDSTYAEDFLLTSRTFLRFPTEMAEHLISWLNGDIQAVKDKAVRIALLWVNNHFSDFEFEPVMNDFLAKFDFFLTSQALEGQMKLLSIACSAKAHQRKVLLSRPGTSEEWPFSVFSRPGTAGLVFISSVRSEKFESESLKLLRGDQILKANGNCIESFSHKQFHELLKSVTQLELTVRFNLEAFREVLRNSSTKPESSSRSGWRLGGSKQREESKVKEVKGESGGSTGIGGSIYFSPKKLAKLFRNNVSQRAPSSADFSMQLPKHDSVAGRKLNSSGSHPDLTFVGVDTADDTTGQLLAISGPNQCQKNIFVSKEMTVAQVVSLAVKEFGLQSPSRYCLCQESVNADNKSDVKLTVLHSHVTNLPGAAKPDSKFCLVSRPTSLDAQLTRGPSEATWLDRYQSGLLPLQPEDLAKQLTQRDLLLFRDIESTEYVVDLFGLESSYGTPNLTKFTETINLEMFWVMTEICVERNIDTRAKLIQKFVKTAKLCKELNNLNSMFFIVSGLSHGAISRLKLTWGRVPAKYHRVLASMQELLDPSRNMSNYRNLLNSQLNQMPAIPFFPIVKKDLTFIHLGNDSKVEGLVNFEKLRMVAKEVRRVTNMASSSYSNFPGQSSAVTGAGSSAAASLQSHTGSSSTAFVFGTLRKKKPLPARLNSRKQLDEVQMGQRVNDYLSNLLIIDDEEKLLELSNQLEPSENFRRKAVSPLPPASSAGISSGTKFGMNSAQAVQKLMSLTDKVKQHDQRKNPIPPTLSVPPPVIHLPDDPRTKASHQSPALVHLSRESSSVTGSLVNSDAHGQATESPTHDSDKTELKIGSEDHPTQPRQPKHGLHMSTGSASFREDPARSQGYFKARSDPLSRMNRPVGTGLGRTADNDGDDELSNDEEEEEEEEELVISSV